MARMRRGGGNWTTIIALVVFVFVSVITTALCFVFYSNATKQEKEFADKNATLQQYVRPSERSQFETAHADVPTKQTGNKGESFTAHLDAELRELKRIVAANESISLDNVRDRWKTEVPDSQPLFGYLAVLKANHDHDDAALKEKDTELAKKDGDIQAAQAEANAAKDRFNATIDEQAKTIKAMDTNYQGEITKLRENLDSLTKAKDQNLADAQSRVKQLENESAQKDQEILGLKSRVNQLMPKRGDTQALPDTSLQAKGHIVSILEDANLVYIDRGRKQHVVSGLTFEVFDHSTGVSKDEHGEMHGKATIEVMNVEEDSSVCRIVRRSPRTTLIEGDVLANAVYDPNYKFKFVVFGDFDIDNSGLATQADRQRIITTIRQWGGTVSDELSYDTDFLVLGEKPKVPEALGPTTDATAIARHAAAVEKYNEYYNLEKQAKGLSVPVLNENRFLALVGYYKR